MEVDEQGNIVLDNWDRIFTQEIHPSEVDLRKYITNCDEYLCYDTTSQAEKEFNTILHQDSSADRTKLLRPTSSSKASRDISCSSSKTASSRRAQGRQTTSTSVWPGEYTRSLLPDATTSCQSS